MVEGFVTRVLALTDDERVMLAEARRGVDEDFHEKALVAGIEAIAARGEEYMHARRLVANAHVPESLADEADDVARLAQLAIDDALIAILASDTLHPNHLRELYRGFAAIVS